ncbi:DUF3077 domain-containing protein [Stutzerimonas stutzeri]
MNRRPVVTRLQGFFSCGGKPMATVNAGVPASDALEHASCLLATVVDLAMNVGESGVRGSEAFAIQYLTEMAKALVDAAAMGCTTQENGGQP